MVRGTSVLSINSFTHILNCVLKSYPLSFQSVSGDEAPFLAVAGEQKLTLLHRIAGGRADVKDGDGRGVFRNLVDDPVDVRFLACPNRSGHTSRAKGRVSKLSGVMSESKEPFKAPCCAVLKKLGGENRVGDHYRRPVFLDFSDAPKGFLRWRIA
jgi:hypothetical protein